MQVTIRQWDRGSRDASLETHEQTFTTKRDFEQLFDNPLVAHRVLELLEENNWGLHQHIVRVPGDLARKHGISTWYDHATVRVDPTHDDPETVYIDTEYYQRDSLPAPDAGEARDVDAALPKDALTFYTGKIRSMPECWSCGEFLRTGEDDCVVTVSKQHFSADEVMDDGYPYPARAELLCDNCTMELVTSDDVDRFGDECEVCSQTQATAVTRLIIPEDTEPSDAPKATVCATCVERESLRSLLRKATEYNIEMVGDNNRRSKRIKAGNH